MTLNKEWIMTGTCKTFTKNYTMVELLVVVSIIGILLAASLSSFPMLFGKQGLVGSVRTLSSKVSMTRSYAVTQGRHVALLIPDKTANTTYNNAELKPYIYSYTRLCYVDSSNKFDGWIEGEEWSQFANGTCASIESPQKVTDVNAVVGADCSALIFQSNGSLINSGNVVIRVNPALYNKETQVLTFNIKGGTIEQKRWNIVIAPFTGKATYLYGKEQ
jgi:prepilin-type N-terminal cleavage/methylation domain-containing protein